ncbi:MAG: 1-deoxy-D-xylulose-5-phosphate reductoisomerase [Dethiobacter sp.]|jgi:1-deoxy-D-xylulose-5-phosphate reductoisomerase|nr:1-deoxy-D-xylulose-5-phosphate reductoisomerase [Dethiobacter sp.]
MTKKIAVLGSTGSIGRQTLDVIENYPGLFQVETLTANSQVKLLAEQARRFHPLKVAVADDSAYGALKSELADLNIKIMAGKASIEELAADAATDIVLNALVGFCGLIPTLAAVRAHKTIALANKETLVAGGHLVMSEARRSNASIIPVDSEHSAIFQCLQGQDGAAVTRLILTASGGPFYGYTSDELAMVSAEQALKHPNWEMGAKITVDSATLMNKGLEVIEAHWLFDIPYDRIDVLVHRESIIHSMVEFADGAVLAQLGLPDMRVPIQYALTYPKRLAGDTGRVDWLKLSRLHFAAPDTDTFPCLQLAFEAGRCGGTMPAVMNAANEEAVRMFLQRQIGFLAIPRIIECVMNKHKVTQAPGLAELLEVDREARETALQRAETERVK